MHPVPGTDFLVQGDIDRDGYFLISGEVEVGMNGRTTRTTLHS
jgi:hypothetical protein